MRQVIKGLKNLSIKGKVTCMTVTFILGFLTVGGMTYQTLREIRVGGPKYNDIVLDKDLLADALPPLLYVVESYLSTHLMQDTNDTATKVNAIQRYKDFKNNYVSSMEAWKQKFPDGEIKTLLAGDVAKSAEAIFATVDAELIPALEKSDAAELDKISVKLERQFFEHKAPIEKLVKLVTEKMNVDQSSAEATANSGTRNLIIASLVTLSLVTLLAFTLRNSVAVTEKVMLDNTGKIDAISRSQASVEFNMDGTIITANDNFLKVAGYSLHEIVGKHHSMFVEESVRSSSQYRDFWSRLNQGQFDAGEYKRINKAGQEIWIQASYNPIVDAFGKPYKVVKFASEITAQKLAAFENAKVRAMMENMAASVTFADKNNIITYANPCALQLLSKVEQYLPVKVSQIVGQSIDVFHRNPAHQKALVANERNFPFQGQIKIGPESFQLSASRILDLEGNFAGTLVSWENVTERLANEQKIKDNTERERQQADELRHQVDSILAVVNAAASGDLTQEVTVKGDDAIGQMGRGLERLLGDLRASICSISENATALAGASEELSAVSTQMSSNAEEASTQANVVSAASEEVSANVRTVTTGVEEMNAAIREIAKNASDAARVSQQAVAVANNTNTMISKLGDSSAEIGKVVKVITSIAEQTNLLALNATIEAARAGEAGKGFAVVANEVKELAKDTAKATEDISHKIEAIQADTQGAVEAIREISEVINQINDISNTIASAVEEQTATANEMGRNVLEASKGSDEIAQNITLVASTAQSTAQGAGNTQQAAGELSRMAAELQQLVSKFKFQKGRVESRNISPTTMFSGSNAGTYQSV